MGEGRGGREEECLRDCRLRRGRRGGGQAEVQQIPPTPACLGSNCKDWKYQGGIHRGGHSSLPRGEARGEHADQRLREPDLQIFRGFIRLKYFCPQEEGVNLALDR